MSEKKIHRTANGQKIDMGQLALQNEHVRAVGNMGVNARGDVINPGNEQVASRAAQVSKTYQKQTNSVQDLPVVSSSAKAPEQKIAGLDEPVVVEEAPVKKTKKAKGGLAGAIKKVNKTK